MSAIFQDRTDAGRQLASALAAQYPSAANLFVFGLPRGGVPVAYEVACALGAPLDVLVVRKLGLPGQPELAMGAIAANDIVILNDDIVHGMRIDQTAIEAAIANEKRELTRRESRYRHGLPGIKLTKHSIAIVVDDGLATGATMKAAIAWLKKASAGRIIVAVPVAASGTLDALRSEVDDVACLATPAPFLAVGAWYSVFPQTSDEEVLELLDLARKPQRRQNN
ncbi:MAG TPA: phosphoribosyltransferase [Eoetvoesiella sp.]